MKDKSKLDVAKIARQLEEEERRGTRKGTFRIEGQFEEAVKKILKAKPESRRPGRKGGKVDSHSKSGD